MKDKMHSELVSHLNWLHRTIYPRFVINEWTNASFPLLTSVTCVLQSDCGSKFGYFKRQIKVFFMSVESSVCPLKSDDGNEDDTGTVSHFTSLPCTYTVK